MVQTVENWSILTCRLVRIRATADMVELDVAVERAEPSGSYPNLLQSTVGSEVTIKSKAAPPSAKAGDRLRIKARLAGPGMIWADPQAIEATQ